MNLREIQERREKEMLCEFATLSTKTLGREHECEMCDMRTEFQRDRDRIIHSKGFRMLKDKTQVFISINGESYRTRLTHTLEVSQVARSIANALDLNETLTEAIALAHDIGHPPFGHAGERALNDMNKKEGFNHYNQGLRMAKYLEREGKGLNLTKEVLDGIYKHSFKNGEAITLEGTIVRFADKIAYVNHDIEDALKEGILKMEDIPEKFIKAFGKTPSERISYFVKDIVKSSMGKSEVIMSDEVFNTLFELREFMFEHVYTKLYKREHRVENVLVQIYNYYKKFPEELPNPYTNDSIHKRICDYICYMTDRQALNKFKELFLVDINNV